VAFFFRRKRPAEFQADAGVAAEALDGAVPVFLAVVGLQHVRHPEIGDGAAQQGLRRQPARLIRHHDAGAARQHVDHRRQLVALRGPSAVAHMASAGDASISHSWLMRVTFMLREPKAGL
jgi:hypothetical protein